MTALIARVDTMATPTAATTPTAVLTIITVIIVTGLQVLVAACARQQFIPVNKTVQQPCPRNLQRW